MKGENILYNNIVPSSLGEQDGGTKSQRNSYLEKRSDAMACRYYYHATIRRRRYDDCLMDLSGEFFLAPETIIDRLKQRVGFVNALVNKKITTAELRRRYPHFDWSASPEKKPTAKPTASLSLF